MELYTADGVCLGDLIKAEIARLTADAACESKEVEGCPAAEANGRGKHVDKTAIGESNDVAGLNAIAR